MKALITFQPNKKYDSFEGSRLRKTIKGALELANVEYTSSVVDEYDIVHLISYDDYARANDALARGIPVVVSALMCEGDKKASYLEFKFDDGKVIYSVPNKAIKFLNKVDHVLVPCINAKNYLIEQGVTSKIDVIMPGVNLSRFDFSREDEKELFFRYFREDKSKKLVIAMGEPDFMQGASTFIDAANKCPEALFYYFLNGNVRSIKDKKIRQLVKHAPSNVHFVDMAPDDIYRSALINASIFMMPNYRYSGVVTILQAMAAKCEVIMRDQDVLPEFIKDNETAHIAKFSETIVSLTKDCLDNKLKSTITAAYEEARKYTLTNVGEKLKKIYQQAIKEKQNGGNIQ